LLKAVLIPVKELFGVAFLWLGFDCFHFLHEAWAENRVFPLASIVISKSNYTILRDNIKYLFLRLIFISIIDKIFTEKLSLILFDLRHVRSLNRLELLFNFSLPLRPLVDRFIATRVR
jgi:hypothetical protein